MRTDPTSHAAAVAQSALVNQLDEREVLVAELRAAEQLSREIVQTLHAREEQIVELIEENQALRRRLVETEDKNGEN